MKKEDDNNISPFNGMRSDEGNFDFEDIDDIKNEEPKIEKQNKESFNFDRNTNQKDADDWDF